MSSTQESGYVYAITNKLFNTQRHHKLGGGIPLVKIGITVNAPTKRAIEGESSFRNKTFLPAGFDVEFAIYAENYKELEKILHIRFKEYRINEPGYGTEWFAVDKEKIKSDFDLIMISNPRNEWWSEEARDVSDEVSEEVVEEVEEVVKVTDGETKESEKIIKKRKKRKKRIENPFSEEDREIFKTQAKISPIRRDIWQKFVRDVNQYGKFTKNTTYRPPKNVEYTGKRMGLAKAMIWERDNM